MPAAARGCRRGRWWAVAREAPFSTTDRSRRGPGTAVDLLRTTLQLVDARARVPLEDSWRSWGTSTGHSPGSSLCGAGGLPAPHPGDVALFWPVNSGHQGHAHPSSARPLVHQPQPQEMPPQPPGSSAWTCSPTQAPHRVSHGSGPQKGPRSPGEQPPSNPGVGGATGAPTPQRECTKAGPGVGPGRGWSLVAQGPGGALGEWGAGPRRLHPGRDPHPLQVSEAGAQVGPKPPPPPQQGLGGLPSPPPRPEEETVLGEGSRCSGPVRLGGGGIALRQNPPTPAAPPPPQRPGHPAAGALSILPDFCSHPTTRGPMAGLGKFGDCRLGLQWAR